MKTGLNVWYSSLNFTIIMSTAPKWKMDIDCVGGKGDSNSAHCTTVNEILERSQLSSNSNISRRSSSSSKSECKTPDSSSYDSRSSRSGSEHSEKSPNWSIRDKTESPTRDGSIKQADTKGEGKGANKKVYHRFSTNENRRFATKKSIPWKCLARKHEPHRFHDANMEKDVTQRISSARLHKIKELRNELYDVQRTLEAVNVENKMLKRLQQRHIRALHKFESAENDLHQLIKRHNSEVRALRQSLRMSQVQERYVSRRLKETEKELLRTKDNVYDLQKLSDDNNLAERSELSRKLSDLTVRMEADDKNIKGLKKQLQLANTCYSRQLATESKKATNAQAITKELQTEINSLHQKLKDKERELDIKNIYANRMPKDLHKYEHLHYQKVLTFSKDTQTDSEMFVQEQANKHDQEEYTLLQEKENNKELDIDEENDSQAIIEAPSENEMQKIEENVEYLERVRLRQEEQERRTEILREELEKLLDEGHEVPEDDINKHMSSLQDESSRKKQNSLKKIDQSSEKSHRRSFLPMPRRHYNFTVATENLHRGLPAIGPICSTSNTHNCRNLKLQGETAELDLDNLSEGYEPSFAKIEKSKQNDAGEDKSVTNTETSLKDRKNSLMEELFGPGYNLKSSFSNQTVATEPEKNLLENESSQAGQTKRKNPDIQVGDSNLTPIKPGHLSSPMEDAVQFQL